ncbi:5-hydroxytryptamine receptor 3A-like [Mugil cephalus]|uniref:5-hydroxytryptamine receptor 3A-like n=1 Tax=Mugil cephalus TaxID=48193 RepID=UPI001FB60F46|nr:5-hydroxytryptamine receptor 3A-like [Mugil cephalus]
MAAPRILAFLALIGVACGQTSDCSYYSLLSHFNLTTTDALLQIMRPVKNWNTTTPVYLDMVMYGILEVNEKSQTVTSHIWVHMQWTNEFLNWNSSDFCGINMLTIPKSKLWVPDIVIQEDVSDSGTIRTGPLLTLLPSGLVMQMIRQKLTYTCQFILNLFPFDEQSCNITFSSMSTDSTGIKLDPISSDRELTFLSELFMITQGEWTLKKIELKNSLHNRSAVSTLIYEITIKRRSMLYVVNLIVPLFYLLVLDLASFFISEARGEKLSFKVTILLSISVLLLILQDMLPSTEDHLPMIAKYFVAVFAMVGLSVLEAMMVGFLMELDDFCARKDQSSESDQVDIQLDDVTHKEPARPGEEVQVKPEKSCLPPHWPSEYDLLRLTLDEVKAARLEAARQNKGNKKSGGYRRAATVLDTVFFVFYCLTVVLFLIYMYVAWLQKVH